MLTFSEPPDSLTPHDIVFWVAFDIVSGLFSRAVLDTVHLAFAIWGIFAWRKDETRPSE